jgi:hypothetical protein
MASDLPIGLPVGKHFGVVKSLRRFGSLTLADARYAASSKTPRHFHETAGFTLLVRGGYREEFRLKSFGCGSGSILFRPVGESHVDVFGHEGAHCVCIEMPEGWLEMLSPTSVALVRCKFVTEQDISRESSPKCEDATM